MSLAIRVDEVRAVLLSDGWHVVADDSFDLDRYEFTDGEELAIFVGDQSPLVPSTGFTFVEEHPVSRELLGTRICGPLTALLAVKLKGHQ